MLFKLYTYLHIRHVVGINFLGFLFQYEMMVPIKTVGAFNYVL